MTTTTEVGPRALYKAVHCSQPAPGGRENAETDFHRPPSACVCVAASMCWVCRVTNKDRICPSSSSSSLPSISEIFLSRCRRKASSVIQDHNQPGHCSATHPLRSGRRFRSIRTRTSRLNSSHRRVTGNGVWHVLVFLTRLVGRGLWQFRVLIFGLCKTPATFESLMETRGH